VRFAHRPRDFYPTEGQRFFTEPMIGISALGVF
jgi:hypothetical protein